MHSCLRTPEIVTTICSLVAYVEDPLWNPNSTRLKNRSLYALARTCKAFEEPALDELYCEVRCIGQLFMCLPRSLWMTHVLGKKCEGASKVFQFQRKMTRNDWEILAKYLPRVRRLVIGINDTVRIDPIAFAAIQSHCGDALFPRLHDLSISFKCELHDDLYPLLLSGPCFRATALHTLLIQDMSPQSFSLVISLIHHSRETLQSLLIDSYSTKAHGWEELSDRLRVSAQQMLRLTSLDLRIPDTSAQRAFLSTFGVPPSLEHLTLETCHYRSGRPVPATPAPTIPLRKVTSLELRGDSSTIENAVRHWLPDMDSLTSLRVQLDGGKRGPPLIALAEKFHKTTKSIHLTYHEYTNMYISMLHPLFQFRSLTELHVFMGEVNPFTNDELVCLVKGLPLLERFSLETVFLPEATLRGLGQLLQACPQLKHLKTGIDITEASNADYGLSTLGLCSLALTSWQVSGSMIDSVEFAARHISRMVPHLHKLTWSDEPCNVAKEEELEWERVNALLAFHRKASQEYQIAVKGIVV
ncbi:hypothetical protein CONPUDRAFT_77101 [Coniophora puteana RWD-64-598 SS2]|uniref:F-box domain-containing protein n=1 Tax=Coniophora puteana (strain RWD-64-598) TaxID=741705 RepID=A0A5M3M8A1_CONPW|nr:uncharacterized protein CONPUDRAFT_77101 [Coniophora puteana RWD-64-598 SS2]EIW75399.1 hypothetical protein CONPUDRAFT_77101 [Coniophora puteana RWD-64-598 SS2]